jgi:hypothetical protein
LVFKELTVTVIVSVEIVAEQLPVLALKQNLGNQELKDVRDG